MCFDHDSLPPLDREPRAGVTTTYEVLTASDDNTFRAFRAAPQPSPSSAVTSRPTSPDAGVVILPDVRGIYPFYEAVAVDLANRGYHAIVIDYYGRTAGTGERPPEFDATAHVMQTTTDGVQNDIEAAATRLRDLGADTIACVGFCFGGRHAFWTSQPRFGFAGVVGFYGMPGIGGPLGPGPTQHADKLAAPVLGIFGGADEYIPVAEVEAFQTALESHGVPNSVHVFPDAPHSFFDIKHDQHAAASAAAWNITVDFLAEATARR